VSAVNQAIAAALQHAQSGRPDLAIAPLQQALREDPRHADAHRLLGAVLFQTGRQPQGLDHAERAAALAPDHAENHFYFGSMLAVSGQIDRAIPVLERAAALDPRSAPVRGLLATCFLQKKDLDTAERYYREAIVIDPKYAEARTNLGSVLQSTGRPQEAVEVFRAAAPDHPSHPGLWTAYCVGLNYAGGVDPAEIRSAHEHYGRILMGLPGQVKTDWPNPRDPDRRLRIGIVSPDLWDHSVAYFIRPILEHRDRAALEAFVYSTGPMSDGMTRRLMGAADVWRDLKGANDQQLLQQIRADGVDILIELSGQTQGSRLTALRLRGAPIQVTYIGYPNTTGVPTIDYRIVDAITDPPGAESMATEKLIRLDGCFLCYSPPDDAPPVAPPPSEANGFITFGSFNSIKKLTPGTIGLWAGLLRAVPRSRLVIKSNNLGVASAQDHLAGLLAKEGISEDRFDLLDRFESKFEHLGAYGTIDIALDTSPYNGTTTTCEAMWMGVPVVSLATGLHAGRVGLSLLTAVGLPELAGSTPDQFHAIALGLAGDPARRAELRRTLRARLARSPLCDAPAFSLVFQHALRALWHQWCRGAAGTGGGA
jgi:predicted O-linked N-acetylglucosamine transferase (SPINDLY family)